MATSNSYSYTETAQQLINDSMDTLGYLGEGETLSASEYQRCLRQLNRIFKAMMVKNTQDVGVHVWQRQVGYMFLSASTGQYVLNASSPQWANAFVTVNSTGNNAPSQNKVHLSNVSNISVNTNIGLVLDNQTLQWVTATAVNVSTNTVTVNTNLQFSMNSNSDIAYVVTDDSAQPPQVIDYVNLRNSQGNDVTLDILTYDQYSALPGKKQPGFVGDPQAIYYESHLVGNSGQGFGYIFTDVDGVIDVTKYLVINYVRELQDIVNPTDELDCPKEWFNAMLWTLAKQMAPTFDMPWSQNMQENWAQAVKLAGNANPKRSAARFVRKTARGIFNSPPHR